MILWACSLFFAGGVLTALTITVNQTWHLVGVVSLPPASRSVLATLVLPEHFCLREKERWGDPSPNWCGCETLGQIHALENPLCRQVKVKLFPG